MTDLPELSFSLTNFASDIGFDQYPVRSYDDSPVWEMPVFSIVPSIYRIPNLWEVHTGIQVTYPKGWGGQLFLTRKAAERGMMLEGEWVEHGAISTIIRTQPGFSGFDLSYYTWLPNNKALPAPRLFRLVVLPCYTDGAFMQSRQSYFPLKSIFGERYTALNE